MVIHKILVLLFIASLTIATNDTNVNKSLKLLSRQKRYLIFPEGSSLQLVYCLTMPVVGKSTIFTIGGTAALAWELPHDPFRPYRKPAEVLHRKDNVDTITIKDAPSKSASSIYLGDAPTPPKKLFIRPISGAETPALQRFPSIRLSPSYNRYRYHNHNYQPWQFPSFASTIDMNQRQKQWQPVYYRQPNTFTKPSTQRYYSSSSVPSSSSIYHQVHRRTRRDLYVKIEKFLSAQNKDGKACLLKAICEVHQRSASGEKGSFMEEIMKVMFRVKPFDEHQNEDRYDHAANKKHNCTEMYPTCASSILHFI